MSENPLEDVDSILDLVQTYGGTYIQLTDLVAVCVQHILLDTDKKNKKNNLALDLRELQGEKWQVLHGSPRYIGNADDLQMFVGSLIRDFIHIKEWLEPSPIETEKGRKNRIEKLQYRQGLDAEIKGKDDEEKDAETISETDAAGTLAAGDIGDLNATTISPSVGFDGEGLDWVAKNIIEEEEKKKE